MTKGKRKSTDGNGGPGAKAAKSGGHDSELRVAVADLLKEQVRRFDEWLPLVTCVASWLHGFRNMIINGHGSIHIYLDTAFKDEAQRNTSTKPRSPAIRRGPLSSGGGSTRTFQRTPRCPGAQWGGVEA